MAEQRRQCRLSCIGLLTGFFLWSSHAFQPFFLMSHSHRPTKLSRPSSPLRLRFSRTSNAPPPQQLVLDSSFPSDAYNQSMLEFYSRVDETLRDLQLHLPQLLRKPIVARETDSEKDTTTVYATNVRLLGPHSEELACNLDELASLSTTLVATTAAWRRANSLWLATTTTSTAGSFRRNHWFQVHCDLALDVSSMRRVRVKWKAYVPRLTGPTSNSPTAGSDSASNAATTTTIEGLSQLELNEEGRVQVLRLCTVSVDGRTINAVGETLATLRKAIKQFEESPWIKSVRESPLGSASLPVLSELRDELLQQASREESGISSGPEPILYVTTDISNAFNSSALSSNNNNMSNMVLVPVDDAVVNTTNAPPYPGSRYWNEYATWHQIMSKFVEYSLPILSGNTTASKDDFRNLFGPRAEFIGMDGTPLATGCERIGDFYRTLSSLRKGTRGIWNVQSVNMDWTTKRVTVDWVAYNPVTVQGTDRFTLDCNATRKSSVTVIDRVEQLKLRVEGNTVRDPEWFRTFFTSVERARDNVVGASLAVDLLQQAGKSKESTSVPTRTHATAPPDDQAAAASVYGILCALHRDLPTLTTSDAVSPPASEYLASNVELRGFLDETLIKGRDAYQQVARGLAGSLRAVMLTGAITADGPPLVRIEFTPERTIRVSLVLELRIRVTPRGGGDASGGGAGLGIPLKLQIVSDYVINPEGKIQEHCLVETRVNGQLTPGDMVSRWIKGIPTTSAANGASSSSTISLQSIVDAVAWARRLADSNTR